MYRLKLKAFANADKSELSMIEVAHEILEEKGDTMAFVDLDSTDSVENRVK